MARAVNVLLQINDKQYDLNKMGLVSLSFDRYLASTKNVKSGVLSQMDITAFDSTGYSLMKLLQQSKSKIRIRYGFEDELSDIYVLNVVKYNATYNNLGAMVSIGAIGSQIVRNFPAETYKPGTSIDTMLRIMAERNGWYIGSPGSKDYVDVDIPLPIFITKLPDESDIDFIQNKILPICNKAFTSITNPLDATFWDYQLVQQNGRMEFFFRPYTTRGTTRRVWKYSYGTSTDNSIISLTNKVDMSFLVNGLTLQIPSTAIDAIVIPESQNDEVIQSIIASKFEFIQELFKKYGLPLIDPSDFKWTIELVETENIGNTSIEELILSKLESVMKTFNSIELSVIGNPKIMPTDLIDLVVKNKDGNINILSSTSAVGSYWRVVGISEEIGLNGYQTNLKLVRENLTNL